jgi:hypothetical protein
MRNRRDIPGPESFEQLLANLYDVADANRAVQGPQVSG